MELLNSIVKTRKGKYSFQNRCYLFICSYALLVICFLVSVYRILTLFFAYSFKYISKFSKNLILHFHVAGCVLILGKIGSNHISLKWFSIFMSCTGKNEQFEYISKFKCKKNYHSFIQFGKLKLHKLNTKGISFYSAYNPHYC